MGKLKENSFDMNEIYSQMKLMFPPHTLKKLSMLCCWYLNDWAEKLVHWKNRGGILEKAQKITRIVFINGFSNNSGEMAVYRDIFGD